MMFGGAVVDATLWGWGRNTSGQIGDGTTTQRASPVQIGSDTTWAFIANSTGSDTGHGIKTDGTLWGWGYNAQNQIGDGTTTQRTSPVQVGSATNWASTANGDVHSHGIKTDGTLWGWGRNTVGQIGDGTTTQRTSPVQIGSATNWASVSNGDLHSHAITG